MSAGSIRSAAVLGAGVMGAQIAAHLANAGVRVHLLDMTADVAREGLERAKTLKPSPFFSEDRAALITPGGFDADLAQLATVDWVIEAVVERLDIKRPLLERVDQVRGAATIVSSNTSGLPIAALGEGRSDGFRRHWLGTHFFNPPRYLHLLEIIPTPDTDPAVVARLSAFADHHLGKGVVVARDTPNFIANHIGLHGVAQMLAALESGVYTIEEIDAITGPILGRPKSATFRTMDIAGLDVLAHVARNTGSPLPIVGTLVERGWLGEKTGQGFYKRQRSSSGETEILTFDPGSSTYRQKQTPRLPAIDAASSIPDLAERTKVLFLGKDKVGEFLRSTLGPTLRHAARVAPEIAYSIDDVDRAMRWGFGWSLGPFEVWDAIGLREVMDATGGGEPPPLVADALAAGRNRFREGGLPSASTDLLILTSTAEKNHVVRRNAGASLVDLGDGVLAVAFHSKMNAIGGDTIQMLHQGVKEAEANFSALVVGTDAADFSAGANLMLLLLEAQEGNWDEIDLMVRGFQGATQALRYAAVPVVVATSGLTLGGGCEIALHGDRVQAAAETYMGLVEAGVGLIPAGGGTKELVVRSGANLQRAFETIGFAKVSTSALDARRLRLLRDTDRVSMNRDRLLADAKAVALERVSDGYQRPIPPMVKVGGETALAALNLGVHLAWRAGRISDHDALIGRTLAGILSGGALPHPTVVSEQYLLDLEREAFLKLCGERKTLERIQHTLKTGKPLRN